MTNGDGQSRRRVVVVGGGISGLAAAHCLAESFDVTLFEASAATGGLIRTAELRGRPIDTAADVFVTRTPDAEKLAWAIGLGAKLVAPATSSASVFARGAVRSFPPGLVLGVPTDLRALWNSGIVSRRSVIRAIGDLLDVTPILVGSSNSSRADPTIAEVVEPRLGREIFANLIDPLLGGINAGDARALSFAATAPTLAEAAAGRTSLIRALRPLAKARTEGDASPMFLGLAEGMSSLTERLTNECVRRGVTIRSPVSARSLATIKGGAFGVETSSEMVTADGVLVALPAWAIARLIRALSSTLASELDTIPYSSVATVALAFELDYATTQRPTGSGVLIPRGDTFSTALTFVSTKWPRPPGDHEFVIRASVGRHGDERPLGLDDDELIRRVGGEIAAILGIEARPIAVHVERFMNAFPQYVSGHFARLVRVARLTEDLGPIALTGSWSGGIGIPACIASAREAAQRLSDRLQ